MRPLSNDTMKLTYERKVRSLSFPFYFERGMGIIGYRWEGKRNRWAKKFLREFEMLSWMDRRWRIIIRGKIKCIV